MQDEGAVVDARAASGLPTSAGSTTPPVIPLTAVAHLWQTDADAVLPPLTLHPLTSAFADDTLESAYAAAEGGGFKLGRHTVPMKVDFGVRASACVLIVVAALVQPLILCAPSVASIDGGSFITAVAVLASLHVLPLTPLLWCDGCDT